MTPGQAIKKAELKLADLDARIEDLDLRIDDDGPNMQTDLDELREAVNTLVRWVKMS